MMEVVAAIGLAAGVGVAAFFSPCAYALLPGYVSYYVAATEGSPHPVGGALLRGCAAATGVLVAVGGLSAAAVTLGAALESVFPYLEATVGVVLVALGGLVLVRGGFHVAVALPERRTGLLGFGLFGGLYAIAGAGCVAPLFLAVVVHSLTLSPAGALATFGAYAVAFAALLVATTVLAALGRSVGTDRVAGFEWLLVRLAGVVLVVAGVGQLGIALS